MSDTKHPRSQCVTANLLLLFAGLLLSSPSALAAPLKACDPMTLQTASQIFGSNLMPGREARVAMGGEQCDFHRNDVTGQLNLGVVDASQIAAGAQVGAAEVPHLIEATQGGTKVEKIPSLGEWNSYVWNGESKYSLTVLYHGKAINLAADASRNPNLKAALVQAMRQIMQKF